MALAGLTFLALTLLLPPLLSSPALREQLERSASTWAGGRVGYREISVGLLPPSLQVAGVRVEARAGEAAPLFSAEQLRLALDLWPLLSGRLQLGSLQLRGVQLHVVRTARGFELPFSDTAGGAEAPPGEEARPSGPAPGEETTSALPVALAVQQIVIREARLRVEDRTLDPPGRWDFLLDGRAGLGALDTRVEVFADVEAIAGGHLEVRGQSDREGKIELALEIDALELAAFGSYLGPDASLAGSLSGTVRVEGPVREPTLLRAELRVSDAAIARADLQLGGELSGEVVVEQPLSRSRGRFEVNADGASLRYAGLVDKPPGVPARVSGRIIRDSQGRLAVEDLALKLRDFEARGALRPGPPLQLELRADPVDLAGWEALLPALAPFAPTGSIELPGLRVDAAPLALHGSLRLRDVRARLPDASPLRLSAELLLEGDVLRSAGARIHLAQQPFELEVRVEDLFGARRFQSSLRAEAVDSDALAHALGGRPGVLSGALSAQGEFSGRLEAGPGIPDSLEGWLDFHIENGTLVGVSLLEAVFQRMEGLSALGTAAIEAGRLFGGRDLQRFYGDRFEQLQGRLVVERGNAFVEPLQLVYRDYGAELRGSVDLSDLSLDARGVLTLYEPIDVVIARNAGAASGYTPTRRRLPLAAVTGTLQSPRVRVDSEEIRGFLAAYASDLYRGRLGEMLEGKLGPDAGKVVDQGLRVLQGILGGGRPRDAAPGPR